MSKQLIESIVSGNMLEASDMLEEKLNQIRERKMYEMKRMYAAESSMGGQDPEELRARGYRPAAAELERRAAEKEKAKADRKAAKAERKKLKIDPYYGKGNAPHIMVKRAIHKAKQAGKKALAKEPAAPGSGVVNATKAIGRGIARASNAPVFSDLRNIGMRNL